MAMSGAWGAQSWQDTSLLAASWDFVATWVVPKNYVVYLGTPPILGAGAVK